MLSVAQFYADKGELICEEYPLLFGENFNFVGLIILYSRLAESNTKTYFGIHGNHSFVEPIDFKHRQQCVCG